METKHSRNEAQLCGTTANSRAAAYASGSPIFLLPTLRGLLIGFLYPFSRGFYLSFCKFTTTY